MFMKDLNIDSLLPGDIVVSGHRKIPKVGSDHSWDIDPTLIVSITEYEGVCTSASQGNRIERYANVLYDGRLGKMALYEDCLYSVIRCGEPEILFGESRK